MTSPLQIVERRANSVTILELSGRLIVDEGDRTLRDCVDSLVSSGRTHLLVDFRNITYVDSGGVGALVSKYLTVRKTGGQLKLMHLNRRSGRVLQIARLLEVFEVFDSEMDALRSFGAPSVTLK
jgi:anti-sigma B factor antagonist